MSLRRAVQFPSDHCISDGPDVSESIGKSIGIHPACFGDMQLAKESRCALERKYVLTNLPLTNVFDFEQIKILTVHDVIVFVLK